MVRIAPLTLALALLLPAPARGDSAWTWPVRGELITAYRNADDPYAAGQHRGIDIAAGRGAPVVAATDGSVTFAGVAGSSGITVGVRTGDGRFDTSYLHLSSAAVRRGDSIRRGDRVGAVGTSGRRSAEQPHLHFGVREAGSDHAYRDPLDFLPQLPAPPAEPEAPRGAPAPVATPLRPSPAPAGAPRSEPARARRPLPAPRLRRPVGSPGRAPRLAPGWLGSAPRPEARVSAVADGARGDAPAASGGRGIDLGWLAACVGLVLAAWALGHPDRARAAAGRSRRTAAALLRPLTGRG
jgi:hypothetical protein